jgi:single-strand DNA-binding protein
MGNLTRDPEFKRTPAGTAVCELRLAINENFRNKEGELIERVVFVDVVLWERQAEVANEYLSKGSPVFIEGRLQYDEWKTPQDETRSKLLIVASRLQLIGAPGQRSQPEQPDTRQIEKPGIQNESSKSIPDPDDDPDDDEIPPF